MGKDTAPDKKSTQQVVRILVLAELLSGEIAALASGLEPDDPHRREAMAVVVRVGEWAAGLKG